MSAVEFAPMSRTVGDMEAKSDVRFHVDHPQDGPTPYESAVNSANNSHSPPTVGHVHKKHGNDYFFSNVYEDQVLDLDSGNNLAFKPVADASDWNSVITEPAAYQAKEAHDRLTGSKLPFWLQWPLFWFPYNTNEWSARFVAIQVVAISIVGIIFRKEAWNWYIWCAMFGDFFLRFVAGGRASVMGTLAEIPAHFLPKIFVPGAPKQFAALCGVLFSGSAALAFFQQDNNADGAAGSVIIGVLMGCAALEGFLNFCVGCFCFNMANRLGIISDDFRIKASRTLDEVERMRYEVEEDRVKPSKEALTSKKLYSLPLAGSQGRALEFNYKTTTDAEKRGDFHPIRHVRMYYFSAAMGVLGLAIQWKLASEATPYRAHVAVWKGLTVISAIFFGAVFLLYALKAIFYPKKVYKEWEHASHHFGFVLMPICILLFIPLTVDKYTTLAEVLFWIGGPLVLFMSAFSIRKLVYYPMANSFFTPAIMFPPLGNLIAALTLRSVHSSYHEAAYLWFGIAVFMWVVLSAVTLNRVLGDGGANLNDAQRSFLWIYLAAPSVVCSSYLFVNDMAFGTWDNFAIITFYISVGSFLSLFLLGLNAYFMRERFSVHYWNYLFPMAAFTIVCELYYTAHSSLGIDFVALEPHYFEQSPTMEGVTTVAMILTNALAAVLFAHTLLALVKRTVFIPEDKFNPSAMFRLQHRAFESAMDRMRVLLLTNGLNSPEVRSEFSLMLSESIIVQEEHSKIEEYIIYPKFRALWPGIVDMVHKQHEIMELEGALSQLQRDFRSLEANEGDPAATLKSMQDLFVRYDGFIRTHFKLEEDLIQGIARKYISGAEAKSVVRRAFYYSPAYKWRQMIHFQLTYDFHHQRKIRFLKALVWAVPEKAQLVGKLVYECVDQFMFERLAVDVPEMVPRNAPGYNRIF